MLSFKHASRGKKCLRVIDELPDELFQRLENDENFRFKSLGEQDGEPGEEKRIEFRRALDAAKLDDSEYLSKLKDAGDDPGERILARLEAELRGRVRERLGMAPRIAIPAASASDVARRRGLDPSFDLPMKSPGGAADRHTDGFIQTVLFAEPMARLLSALRDEVRSSLEETGVNPLFCVFGFLEWFEAESSEVQLHAPLLLLPLEIDRELVRGQWDYRVKSSGEGMMVNVALAERLKRDFDIMLPPFSDDDTPELYFARVLKVIESKRGWKLRRWVSIGLFSFAKIVMYHDLDPTRWPGEKGLIGHPGLSRLLAGENDSVGADYFAAEQVGVGHTATTSELDEAEMSVPLITDADSSQLEAIRAVISGRSLVIEGPPGTGKSQTITNMIASAIGSGKSVLFIAEKMAALNVVRNRLDDAGLGDFCFELHSTKAGRRETFNSIDRRLKRPRDRRVEAELESVARDLRIGRKNLSSLVDALGQPAGKLSLTVQQILWRVQTARAETNELPREIDELWLQNTDQLTESDLSRAITVAQYFETNRSNIIREYGSIERNPWHGLAKAGLDFLACEQAVIRVSGLSDAAAIATSARQNVADLTGWHAERLCDLSLLGGMNAIVPPSSCADDAITSRIRDGHAMSASRQFVSQVNDLRVVQGKLDASFKNLERPVSSRELRALGSKAEHLLGSTSKVSELDEQHSATILLANRLVNISVLLESARTKIQKWVGCTNDDPLLLALSCDEAIVVSAKLASSADDSILRGRTGELTAVDALPIIQRAAHEQRLLISEQEQLAKQFVLAGCPSANHLLQLATAIRTAPFIPYLSGSFRKSKQEWKSLCRTPRNSSRTSIIEDLEKLAEFKTKLERFESDKTYSRTLGVEFSGIQSDLAGPMRIAEWARGVHSQFAAGEPDWAPIELFLLNGDARAVQVLADLARTPSFEELCRIVSAPGSKGVTLWASEVADRRDRLASACVLNSTLGLAPHVTIADIPDLAASLDQRDHLRDELDRAEPVRSLLGPSFNGPLTDTESLKACIEYSDRVQASELPVELRQWLLEKDSARRFSLLKEGAAAGMEALSRVQFALATLNEVTPIDSAAWLRIDDPLKARADDLKLHCDACAQNPSGLQLLVEDARYFEELRMEGLTTVLDALLKYGVRIDRLSLACRRVLLQSMAKSLMSRSPALVNFSGERHDNQRKTFQTLDRKLQVLRRSQIVSDLLKRRIPTGSDRGPRNEWTELALVLLVTSQQKPRTTIRHLLKQAGNAVQQLMPCFMMSPISVAQYLQPGTLKFDLVIMDEASQLRPEDAMGAIARGGQVVIVGDPKQLPPTNFFSGAQDAPDDDEEITVADESSILDAAITVLRPMKRLKWHYRSRHASLIAFSNKEFYDNELVVFPSPQHHHAEYGVKYVHVEDGCYRAGTNPKEVERVAAAVLEHARLHPERSLGVVAMNIKQTELLRLELDRLSEVDDVFEAWRKSREGTLEPFFVKNLENVQGDERDVILISTVYGKDESGGPTKQRFGPINNAGGHRRLNVLFTRSKLQTVVYSTMQPGDIRVDEKTSKGAQALQGYLKYAKDRSLDRATVGGREPDSDFEIAVANAVRKAGFEVVPQVGVVGYFIDLAVRHPELPGEFALGVECDGATYHSSKSARDRDRLRQEVLERLGWRIHRIWSLDWFRDPAKETARLMHAINEATVTVM